MEELILVNDHLSELERKMMLQLVQPSDDYRPGIQLDYDFVRPPQTRTSQLSCSLIPDPQTLGKVILMF